MFPNLKAEMARQNITQSYLAKEIGVTEGTMSLKLNGKNALSLEEAKKIRNILNVKESLDYLFKKED